MGMGRSYGDVCLLKDGTLLQTTGMNRLLEFDPQTGLLTASRVSRWRRSSILRCLAGISCR